MNLTERIEFLVEHFGYLMERTDESVPKSGEGLNDWLKQHYPHNNPVDKE